MARRGSAAEAAEAWLDDEARLKPLLLATRVVRAAIVAIANTVTVAITALRLRTPSTWLPGHWVSERRGQRWVQPEWVSHSGR